MLIEALLIGGTAKALYNGNKALNMDAQAIAKYGKAFTKEYEAQQLVEKKKQLADKRLENVAKKKRAIINSNLPMFVGVYEKIQKIDIESKDRQFEMIQYSDIERNSILGSVEIVTKKEFTSQELILGTAFKGIDGMAVEDSKRNLSAARSQMRVANVAYSQAQSIAEVYDAIIGRSDRIAKLLMNMNALFIEIISQTEKIISVNGTNVKKYSEKDKSVMMMCVNFAVAITQLLDIPILDENSGMVDSAVEMIQTGEDYLSRMNELINQ